MGVDSTLRCGFLLLVILAGAYGQDSEAEAKCIDDDCHDNIMLLRVAAKEAQEESASDEKDNRRARAREKFEAHEKDQGSGPVTPVPPREDFVYNAMKAHTTLSSSLMHIVDTKTGELSEEDQSKARDLVERTSKMFESMAEKDIGGGVADIEIPSYSDVEVHLKSVQVLTDHEPAVRAMADSLGFYSMQTAEELTKAGYDLGSGDLSIAGLKEFKNKFYHMANKLQTQSTKGTALHGHRSDVNAEMQLAANLEAAYMWWWNIVYPSIWSGQTNSTFNSKQFWSRAVGEHHHQATQQGFAGMRNNPFSFTAHSDWQVLYKNPDGTPMTDPSMEATIYMNSDGTFSGYLVDTYADGTSQQLDIPDEGGSVTSCKLFQAQGDNDPVKDVPGPHRAHRMSQYIGTQYINWVNGACMFPHYPLSWGYVYKKGSKIKIDGFAQFKVDGSGFEAFSGDAPGRVHQLVVAEYIRHV